MKYLFFLIALLPLPALAESPKEAFEGLRLCMEREAASCGDYFTADSQELYGKVVQYNLARCVPEGMEYVSDMASGNRRIVRARFSEQGKPQTARLAFAQEEGHWKFDVPHTLKGGLGEKWQGYVAATEQAYLFLQNQMRTAPGCEAVKALAGSSGQAKP